MEVRYVSKEIGWLVGWCLRIRTYIQFVVGFGGLSLFYEEELLYLMVEAY